MKRHPQQQKDFYLIAQKIQNQSPSNDLDNDTNSRFKKESEEALKMIDAYRKVQNIKSNLTNKIPKIQQLPKQPNSQQPKSTYANKIKQTLRQLNANKAKQYQKLSQKSYQLKSQANMKSLHVINQQGSRSKSQQQKKLITKAVQKIYLLLGSLLKKVKKNSFYSIINRSQDILENEYVMARKYRLFRLFSLWKEETRHLKIENQRQKNKIKQKQISATQMANQFRIFSVYKKVLKHWSKTTKMEKKKRVYERELKQIQAQRNLNIKKGQLLLLPQKQPQCHSANDQLQNKLKGFLNGLKQKMQIKQNKAQLHPITEHNQQSQQASHVFSQSSQPQPNQNTNPQQNPNQQQHQQPHPQSNQQSKQPLSNQVLQKNRQQIYERSKQRKQALQKLKRQKQHQKKKQDQERKVLEKQIEEENKKIKELKYKEFHQRKKLQKEWEQRETQLNTRADQWNRLRILKFYGFDNWKSMKAQNLKNAQIFKTTVEKIMTHHAGMQLFENLQKNLHYVLECLYTKMNRVYERNLKKKCMKGMKLQLVQVKQQKFQLQAFHQVHTQKIFIAQWRRVLDLLRLENMEQERPLIKKANEYNRVSLMLRSLRGLRENGVEGRKEKNINVQKQKIKSKIKNIISEKIQINFDQFL